MEVFNMLNILNGKIVKKEQEQKEEEKPVEEPVKEQQQPEPEDLFVVDVAVTNSSVVRAFYETESQAQYVGSLVVDCIEKNKVAQIGDHYIPGSRIDFVVVRKAEEADYNERTA
jgi:hypothetical protein